MKFISILLILFSSASFACENWIPKSEAIKAINQVPNAGSKTCKDLRSEKCFCFDEISEWEYAEIVPEKNTKSETESCSDESDCQDKLESKTCQDINERPVKNLDSFEVYCTKLIPEHIGENAAKKAAHLQAIADAKAQKEAEKQSHKDNAKKANMSNKEMQEAIKYLLNKVQ